MDIRWEVIVSVVHTDRVDLFFVTLDTVGGADVISEDPSLSWLRATSEGVVGSTSEEGCSDICKIPVDCVSVHLRLVQVGSLLLHSETKNQNIIIKY